MIEVDEEYDFSSEKAIDGDDDLLLHKKDDLLSPLESDSLTDEDVDLEFNTMMNKGDTQHETERSISKPKTVSSIPRRHEHSARHHGDSNPLRRNADDSGNVDDTDHVKGSKRFGSPPAEKFGRKTRSRSPSEKNMRKSRSMSPSKKLERKSRSRSPSKRNLRKSRSMSGKSMRNLRSKSPSGKSMRNLRSRSPDKDLRKSRSRSPFEKNVSKSRSRSPSEKFGRKSRSRSPSERIGRKSRSGSPSDRVGRKSRSGSPSEINGQSSRSHTERGRKLQHNQLQSEESNTSSAGNDRAKIIRKRPSRSLPPKAGKSNVSTSVNDRGKSQARYPCQRARFSSEKSKRSLSPKLRSNSSLMLMSSRFHRQAQVDPHEIKTVKRSNSHYVQRGASAKDIGNSGLLANSKKVTTGGIRGIARALSATALNSDGEKVEKHQPEDLFHKSLTSFSYTEAASPDLEYVTMEENDGVAFHDNTVKRKVHRKASLTCALENVSWVRSGDGVVDRKIGEGEQEGHNLDGLFYKSMNSLSNTVHTYPHLEGFRIKRDAQASERLIKSSALDLESSRIERHVLAVEQLRKSSADREESVLPTQTPMPDYHTGGVTLTNNTTRKNVRGANRAMSWTRTKDEVIERKSSEEATNNRPEELLHKSMSSLSYTPRSGEFDGFEIESDRKAKRKAKKSSSHHKESPERAPTNYCSDGEGTTRKIMRGITRATSVNAMSWMRTKNEAANKKSSNDERAKDNNPEELFHKSLSALSDKAPRSRHLDRLKMESDKRAGRTFKTYHHLEKKGLKRTLSDSEVTLGDKNNSSRNIIRGIARATSFKALEAVSWMRKKDESVERKNDGGEGGNDNSEEMFNFSVSSLSDLVDQKSNSGKKTENQVEELSHKSMSALSYTESSHNDTTRSNRGRSKKSTGKRDLEHGRAKHHKNFNKSNNHHHAERKEVKKTYSDSDVGPNNENKATRNIMRGIARATSVRALEAVSWMRKQDEVVDLEKNSGKEAEKHNSEELFNVSVSSLSDLVDQKSNYDEKAVNKVEEVSHKSMSALPYTESTHSDIGSVRVGRSKKSRGLRELEERRAKHHKNFLDAKLQMWDTMGQAA